MTPPNTPEPIDQTTLILFDLRERMARLETVPEDIREMKGSMVECAKDASQAKNEATQNSKDIEDIEERMKWQSRALVTVVLGVIGNGLWKFIGG